MLEIHCESINRYGCSHVCLCVFVCDSFVFDSIYSCVFRGYEKRHVRVSVKSTQNGAPYCLPKSVSFIPNKKQAREKETCTHTHIHPQLLDWLQNMKTSFQTIHIFQHWQHRNAFVNVYQPIFFTFFGIRYELLYFSLLRLFFTKLLRICLAEFGFISHIVLMLFLSKVHRNSS